MEGLIHFPSQSLTGVTLGGTRKRLGGISPSDTTLTPRLRAFFAEIGVSIGRPIEIVDGPMLRIPVSLTSAHVAAYTLDSTLPCLSGWVSLQHIEGSFALTRGYKLPVSIFLRKNETALAERITEFLRDRQANGPWPPALTYASTFFNPRGCALNLTRVGVP